MLIVNKKTCVGCGFCQTFCPRDALRAWGDLLVDNSKCDDCGACVKCCPTDSLKVVVTEHTIK